MTLYDVKSAVLLVIQIHTVVNGLFTYIHTFLDIMV